MRVKQSPSQASQPPQLSSMNAQTNSSGWNIHLPARQQAPRLIGPILQYPEQFGFRAGNFPRYSGPPQNFISRAPTSFQEPWGKKVQLPKTPTGMQSEFQNASPMLIPDDPTQMHLTRMLGRNIGGYDTRLQEGLGMPFQTQAHEIYTTEYARPHDHASENLSNLGPSFTTGKNKSLESFRPLERVLPQYPTITPTFGDRGMNRSGNGVPHAPISFSMISESQLQTPKSINQSTSQGRVKNTQPRPGSWDDIHLSPQQKRKLVKDENRKIAGKKQKHNENHFFSQSSSLPGRMCDFDTPEYPVGHHPTSFAQNPSFQAESKQDLQQAQYAYFPLPINQNNPSLWSGARWNQPANLGFHPQYYDTPAAQKINTNWSVPYYGDPTKEANRIPPPQNYNSGIVSINQANSNPLARGDQFKMHEFLQGNQAKNSPNFRDSPADVLEDHTLRSWTSNPHVNHVQKSSLQETLSNTLPYQNAYTDQGDLNPHYIWSQEQALQGKDWIANSSLQSQLYTLGQQGFIPAQIGRFDENSMTQQDSVACSRFTTTQSTWAGSSPISSKAFSSNSQMQGRRIDKRPEAPNNQMQNFLTSRQLVVDDQTSFPTSSSVYTGLVVPEEPRIADQSETPVGSTQQAKKSSGSSFSTESLISSAISGEQSSSNGKSKAVIKKHKKKGRKKKPLVLPPPKVAPIEARSGRSSTSAYRGVSWSSRDQRWRADLRFKRRLKFLGCFNEEKEAAIAYDKAVLETLPRDQALSKINFLESAISFQDPINPLE